MDESSLMTDLIDDLGLNRKGVDRLHHHISATLKSIDSPSMKTSMDEFYNLKTVGDLVDVARRIEE